MENNKFDEKNLDDDKKLVINHQLEEWKILNEYVNKMDLSYQQPFVIVIAIIAGIATFLSGNSEKYNFVVFIFPIGLAAVLAYVTYQFRITAILRGHLARLEERMNETLGVDVHMWNSALVETYMAHNNVINSFMMFPMMVFCVVVLAYCFWVTLQMTLNGDVSWVIQILYWSSVFICFACIILPSILGNEKIRAKTYFEEDVWKYYKILRNKKIDAYKRK